MGKKRWATEHVVLPDGCYWYHPFVDKCDGWHLVEWRLAEIVGGKFRQIGVSAVWELDCDYLRKALWLRIEPPSQDAGASEGIGSVAVARQGHRVPTGNRDDEQRLRERIAIVAEGIVDAFIEMHDSTIVYYARHPGQRNKLVAQISRLIGRVRE